MTFWRFVGVAFMSVLIFGLFIVLHEQTHYTIFKEFGCEDIRYGWNEEGDRGIYTVAKCSHIESFGEMQLAQANNEIVGYNIMPALFLIIMMLVMKE